MNKISIQTQTEEQKESVPVPVSQKNNDQIEFADLSGVNGWASHVGNVIVSGRAGGGHTNFTQHYVAWAVENKKSVILVDGDNCGSWEKAKEWLFRHRTHLSIKCSGWHSYKAPKVFFGDMQSGLTVPEVDIFDVWRSDPERKRMAIQGIIQSIEGGDSPEGKHISEVVSGYESLNRFNIQNLFDMFDESEFLSRLRQIFGDWAKKSPCWVKYEPINIQDLLKQGIPIILSVTGEENGLTSMFGQFIMHQYHEFVVNHSVESIGSLFAWDGHFCYSGVSFSNEFFENVRSSGGKLCIVWEGPFSSDNSGYQNHRELTLKELIHFDKVVMLPRKRTQKEMDLIGLFFQLPSNRMTPNVVWKNLFLLQKKHSPQLYSFAKFDAEATAERIQTK